MKQLLNERNKVLAALMIQKQKEGENFSAADQTALTAAIARMNARARKVRAKNKGTEPKRVKSTNNSAPIDWDSGTDARAEGHIAKATVGVKKPTKAQARAAARAHGEKVEEGRRAPEGQPILFERSKRKLDRVIASKNATEAVKNIARAALRSKLKDQIKRARKSSEFHPKKSLASMFRAGDAHQSASGRLSRMPPPEMSAKVLRYKQQEKEAQNEGRRRLKRKGDAIIRRSGGVIDTNFEDPHFGKEARNEKDGDNRNTFVKIRNAKKGSKERKARIARRKEKYDNTI